jgi:6-phosphogluconolactonase
MEPALRSLRVFPDAKALAEAAAIRIIDALAHSQGRSSVCLAGGSTPMRLYRLLTNEPYRSALPWDRVHWFWGDERFVRSHDSRSNSGTAYRLFLSRVPAPLGNIHPVPTTAADPADSARQYEAALRSFYGFDCIRPQNPLFDIVLLGVGADGHTASLFPGHCELNEVARWAVDVAKPTVEPFVPRVSLTFPVLASTRDMLFLVSGRGKRNIIGRILSGADVPAARAYSHGALAWFIDAEAASQAYHVI